MASLLDSWPVHAYVRRYSSWLEAKNSIRVPVAAFLFGALLSQAFAPTNFFPALFIALPFFLFLIATASSGKDAFRRGWWAGFGFFSLGLYWIGHSFTQQDHVPVILAPFATFALSGVMALYVAISFWMTWRLRVTGFSRVLVFAACWTLMEIARGTWFTGFPWHLLGSAWADWNYTAQGAYWVSVYGLTFLTVLAAGLGGSLLLETSGRKAVAGALGGAAIMLAVTGLGYSRVAGEITEYHLSASLKMVQANVKQREKWLSHLIDDHFENHVRLSRGESAKAEGTKLLIWPETAVQRQTFDRKDSLHRWRLSRLLEYNSYAITGAPRYEVEDQKVSYFNSVFVVNSKGNLFARYDKNHLVPFGEYLPFGRFLEALGLSQLTGGSPYSEGTARDIIQLPGVPGFVSLICYESIFPGEIVSASKRPEWLLNLSNDAWFGETGGPYQHLALTRLRAIEEGLPLVRSTSTGITAVIDGYGRTVTSLGLGKQGVVESPLPKALAAPAVPTGVRILAVLFLSAGIILFTLMQRMRVEKAAADASE